MNDQIKLSSTEEILKYYKEKASNGDKYYLLNGDIITNIPKSFYSDPRVSVYKPPQEIKDVDQELLLNLAQYIEMVHSHPNLPNFKSNACFDNSRLFFSGINDVKIQKSLKLRIVFGVYSHTLPYAETPEGYIVDNKEIFIHDWHVWNYVNGMLIDTTILKQQHTSTVLPQDWGRVEDHIFLYPNEGDIYQGIEFTDYFELEKYYKSLFAV